MINAVSEKFWTQVEPSDWVQTGQKKKSVWKEYYSKPLIRQWCIAYSVPAPLAAWTHLLLTLVVVYDMM